MSNTNKDVEIINQRDRIAELERDLAEERKQLKVLRAERDSLRHSFEYETNETEVIVTKLNLMLGGDENDGTDEVVRHAKRVVEERDALRAALTTLGPDDQS